MTRTRNWMCLRGTWSNRTVLEEETEFKCWWFSLGSWENPLLSDVGDDDDAAFVTQGHISEKVVSAQKEVAWGKLQHRQPYGQQMSQGKSTPHWISCLSLCRSWKAIDSGNQGVITALCPPYPTASCWIPKGGHKGLPVKRTGPSIWRINEKWSMFQVVCMDNS